MERFDTFNQYWTTVSSLHQARSGLGVAVMEGMIYVVGGEKAALCLKSKVNFRKRAFILFLFLYVFLPTGEKDSMIFDCTERYDPVTKQWAAVASLNFPRCGVGVCPCHGALYALGKTPRHWWEHATATRVILDGIRQIFQNVMNGTKR